MSKELPIEILNSVEKPERYTGPEFGSIIKTPEETQVSVCLAFPDTYEVGMSYLGFKILYPILNRLEGVAAERAFAPWMDMEAKLREHKIPLRSVETGRALSDFSLVGFTLQYELSYSNILNMLDLGNITVLAKDRGENEPFIMVGGPCVFNCEPLTDFIDFAMLGDGEDVIAEVAETYKKWQQEGKPGGRKEFLNRVVQLQGVYVPSFYDVTYFPEGKIKEVKPNNPLAPRTVYKRVVKDLDATFFPTHPIVPYGTAVHDRIMLELFRGCSRGCRFCNAGIIYRPVRERRKEVLEKLARELVDSTGYDEISLFSLSTADYSCLTELVQDLLAQYKDERIGISLPSLRIDSFSVKLAQEVQTVRKSGLTFAPEAGSQRMRDVINKGVTKENLMNAVEAAFKNGWSTVKLYFMIGLPGETDEDVVDIVNLAKSVQYKYKEVTGHGGARVTVSVSNFVPKPYTPFQWVGQNIKTEFDRKHMLLKNNINVKNINYQYHDSTTSLLEGVFARGDRRCGKALYLAWQLGARFDGWSEGFSFERWEKAFAQAKLPMSFYNARERDKDEIFPWEHTSPGVERSFLWREYEKAQEAQLTEDCRRGKCTGCGICQKLDVKIIDWKDEGK